MRKRRMGRPNGHSPKDKVIRMLVKSIKTLTEKKKTISDQLKAEKKTLGLYRKSVSKRTAPKRRYRRSVKKVVRRRRTKVAKVTRKFDSFKIVKVKKVAKRSPVKKETS